MNHDYSYSNLCSVYEYTFPQCTLLTESDSFYRDLASLTGGYHLHLDDFTSVVDMIVAICLKEQSTEQMQVHECGAECRCV